MAIGVGKDERIFGLWTYGMVFRGFGVEYVFGLETKSFRVDLNGCMEMSYLEFRYVG
jgi:hypothetical protein